MSENLINKNKTTIPMEKSILTRAERLEHYKRVLDSYVNEEDGLNDVGICDRIWRLWYKGNYPSEKVHELYPEFATFKPENTYPYEYWFETTEERIKCLKKCIEMCEIKTGDRVKIVRKATKEEMG